MALSKLLSELLGRPLGRNEHEFRVHNFDYREGEVYVANGNRYLVVALGPRRDEGPSMEGGRHVSQLAVLRGLGR